MGETHSHTASILTFMSIAFLKRTMQISGRLILLGHSLTRQSTKCMFARVSIT